MGWKVQERQNIRKSLYTYAKKEPSISLFPDFDAEAGSINGTRKRITNTPLQALVTS